MAYDIFEINLNLNCNYCGEELNGFIVFGKHTTRKQGGSTLFSEHIYEKILENGEEHIKMFVNSQCPSCHINNVHHVEYNMRTGDYDLLQFIFDEIETEE